MAKNSAISRFSEVKSQIREVKKSEKRSGTKQGKKKRKEKSISPRIPASKFLPMSLEEVKARGWKELDIILVTGDAYIDHSSFGTAIIGRVLEDAGFRVGVITQPRWDSPEDFKKLGKPRLFFSVSAGNTDSMVSNLTPGLKPRNKDAYSPGGKAGLRPNRAVIIYSNRIKEAFPEVPIVLGGIEASLRRFAHYDYLSDRVRQSILADAPADLIVYGMGELQIVEIAKRLQAGEDIKNIKDIPGTVWKMEVKAWKEFKERTEKPNNTPNKQEQDKQAKDKPEQRDRKIDEDKDEFLKEYVEIPSFSEVFQDKTAFAKAFRIYFAEQNPVTGRGVIQSHPKTVIVQNRPMRLLTETEMDHVYELPFTGEAHPSYTEPIPALEMVKFSLTTHRGCFGGCAFCAITEHQGRMIASRSIESVLREAKKLTEKPDFKGVINGVGGPSANMYGMECKTWEKKEPALTNPAFILAFALLWIPATKSCLNSYAACANFQELSKFLQVTGYVMTWLLRMKNTSRSFALTISVANYGSHLNISQGRLRIRCASQEGKFTRNLPKNLRLSTESAAKNSTS